MQVCTSLQTDNHASTPPLSFLQAGCPSYHPTNSVNALKAMTVKTRWQQNCFYVICVWLVQEVRIELQLADLDLSSCPNVVFCYGDEIHRLKYLKYCRYSKVYEYTSLQCNIATPLHEQYGITQCYLPVDRGDILLATPAEAGTRFSDPGVMHGCSLCPRLHITVAFAINATVCGEIWTLFLSQC